MLRIKLVKIGKKNRPTWRVVVVEKTKTGKGRVTDYIGSYNPHSKPKDFKIDIEKYDNWIKNGAQPTDSVLRLKGNFIDKTKDYQKEVKAKVYKSKKPEEVKKEAVKAEKEKVTEVAKEIKEDAIAVEDIKEAIAEAATIPEPEEKKEEPAVEEKAEEEAK